MEFTQLNIGNMPGPEARTSHLLSSTG